VRLPRLSDCTHTTLIVIDLRACLTVSPKRHIKVLLGAPYRNTHPAASPKQDFDPVRPINSPVPSGYPRYTEVIAAMPNTGGKWGKQSCHPYHWHKWRIFSRLRLFPSHACDSCIIQHIYLKFKSHICHENDEIYLNPSPLMTNYHRVWKSSL
jgi:hypothetical protein